MEIADVKRRVVETIDRAKRRAVDRRLRMDEATKAYEAFLDRTAVPIFRQVANVLKAHGYPFNVYTPGGSVRLVPERGSEDYIELALDTTGDEPIVTGHRRRGRGRRHGMVPLSDALVPLVQNGVVDAREAYRHVTDRTAFLALLKRQGIDTSFVERLA